MGTKRNAKRDRGQGRRLALICFVLLVVGASCGSADPVEAASSSSSAPAPTVETVEPEPTAQPEPTVEPEPTAEPEPTEAPADVSTEPFAEISDILYMSVDGTDFLMDVFVPPGEGPFPVVVSFHGCCGDPEGKDIPPTTAVAEAAATQGMVVFTPTWLTFADIPLTESTLSETGDRVACAVALAQQVAAEYGGDSTTTVVDGFSAGATAALALAADGPRSEAIAGCATDAVPGPIEGFVLGDVESWLHSNFWDGAYAASPEVMQSAVASWLDPESWDRDGIELFVWTTEDEAQPRPVDDPTGWVDLRDPDGSIQADLERLGQLVDGVVDYRDAAELLHLRLTDAGLVSTLDVYPGAHTTLDKVPEIVGYLQSAAT